MIYDCKKYREMPVELQNELRSQYPFCYKSNLTLNGGLLIFQTVRPEDLLLLKDIIFITADITHGGYVRLQGHIGHIRLDADCTLQFLEENGGR